MMKAKKDSPVSRILAWVLAIALIVGMVPSTSFTAKAAADVYGTVEAITNGISIIGEASSSDVQVTNTSSLSLKWEAADTTLGRNEDGWWAGIKMVVPDSLTESELENVKLQKRESIKSEWSGDILFQDVKDADTYVGLWTLLTPAILKEANTNNTTVVKQWQFDWNNDGAFEQLVTLTVDPEKVILSDANNAQAYPELGKVEVFSGGTVNGSKTGNVNVVADQLQLKWEAADKTLGRNEDGWWAGIKVTAPEYLTASELEDVTLQKREGTAEKWSDKILFKDVKDAENYVGLWTLLTPAILEKAEQDGVNIVKQWQFDWNNDGAYEQLISLNIIPSDKIVLVKKEQSALSIYGLEEKLTYTDKPIKIEVSGGTGDGSVIYEITEGTDVATVDNEGNLRLLKAGTFTVQVSKLGNDVYNNAVPVSKTITVEKATQTGFYFKNGSDIQVTYNDNGNAYSNVAVGGQSGKNAIYEILANTNTCGATLDAETGVVKFEKAGTVKVKAVKPEDERYLATSVEYVLTINKDTQAITFENGKNITLNYGLQSYKNIAKKVTDVAAADGKGYGKGTITYEITGNNSLDVTPDANGTIVFKDAKTGTVTVKATKAADECYEACSEEYKLTLKCLEIPTNPYVLSGDAINESGWYTGNVTIAAPEGYEISYSNTITGNAWASSVSYTSEGANDVVIYLREQVSGSITDAIEVKALKIDKTLPSDLKITYSEPSKWVQVLTNILHGIFKEKVKVTLTATDTISGIDKFEYTFKNSNDMVTVNADKLTFEENKATYTFSISPEYRDQIVFSAYDVAGQMESTIATDDKNNEIEVVIDTIAPVIDVEYEFADEGKFSKKNDTIYTRDDVTVKFSIEEANFDLSEKPVVTVNAKPVSVEWVKNTVTGKWDSSYTVSGEGDYVVQVDFTDVADEKMDTFKQEIHIDKTAPVIKVETVENKYYGGANAVSITVTEHNFDPSDMVIALNATRALEPDKIKDYASILKDLDNWTDNGDVHTSTIIFEEDADYQFTLDYTDLAGNKAEQFVSEKFVIDNINPVIGVKVEPSTPTNGKYYKEARKATITITEHNFDSKDVAIIVDTARELAAEKIEDYAATLVKPESWTHAGDVHTAVIAFTEDADYQFTLDYTDLSGRQAVSYESEEFVIDNIDPVLDVNIAQPPMPLNGKYYNEARTAIITITEHNFDSKDIAAKFNVTRALEAEKIEDYAAALVKPESWTHDGDVHTATITFTEDADYQFTLDYTDLAGNKAEQFVSEEFVIDNIDPVIDVKIAPASPLNGKYYKDARTATITITEHNFDSKDVVAKFNITRALEAEKIEDYAVTLVKAENWTHNGDVHTATITFVGDANYQFTLDYTDLAGNKAKQFVSEEFVVDNIDPVIDVKIAPASPLNGKYYKDARTATITITEHNFDSKDVVAKFNITRALEAEKIEDYAATLVKAESWKQNGDVHTATITFTEDADYQFTLDYTDLSGRKAASYVSEEFVVDNIDPIIGVKIAPASPLNGKYYKDARTATITITEHNFDSKDVAAVVNTDRELAKEKIEDYAATLVNPESWTQNGDVYTAEITFTEDADYQFALDYTDLSGRKAVSYASEKFVIDNVDPVLTVKFDNNSVSNEKYYNDARTATIIITEHNFDSKDVVAKVVAIRELDSNGEIEDYAVTLVKPESWTHDGDVHTAEITFKEDADYQFMLDYTDLSGRVIKQYKTEFVIDNVDPILNVEYTNQNVINTIGERKYLDDVQEALVTIIEHNFDAKYVDVLVEAVDAAGAQIIVENGTDTLTNYYNALYKDNNVWTHDGDVHTAVIQFKQDANYKFDIQYKDLADRNISDYQEEEFTVDTIAPTNLEAVYSTSQLETNIDQTDFGYYNSQVNVTISGEDATSGVYSFMYSYINSIGVSNVNAELIDAIINSADITQKDYKFVASFTIPQEALSADKQFNGTIEFTAFDTSGNNTEKVEEKRIVVDNIKPTIQVTFNDPVNTQDTQSFYDGDVQGTIIIEEANFFAEDVEVIATRDGAEYVLNVNWVDDSVDKHTGTFTLTEDGDYFITLRYADRSTNQMDEYVSNELTIDTEHPTINVSNIVMNSANKDEKYGFTITVDDINFDANTFTPVLTVVAKDENGVYTTKEISLGSMHTIEAGKSYSFTVENLDADGIYSLHCTVQDMSNNEYAQIMLADGREYETVQFSINRDGSTFTIDENTKNVLENYYVFEVGNNVVIEEVNVDPVENYVVKLNGKVLTEGSDYTTRISGGTAEWSKRTYSIKKELFSAEGEYSVVIESVDKTNTTSYSDVKGLVVKFVVDQTEPVLTISGLADGGRYQTSSQTVTVIPTDDGGRLFSFKAIVLDENGNPLTDKETGEDISIRFAMEGEELLKFLEENDGKITFTVPEGYENKVQIICNDCTVKEDGKANEYNYTFEKVTVSPSGLVIFYADKPVFYGTIVGIVALASGTIWFILAKKRKKNEQ